MNKLLNIVGAIAIALPVMAAAYQLEINGHIYHDETGADLDVTQIKVEQVAGKIIVTTLPGSTDKVCYDNCSSGPANQPPVISTTSLNNTEGTLSIGQVQASDPDTGDSLSFSLAGGTNASLFSITSSGVLSFITTSSSGSYTVNVKVEDNASSPLSDTQAIIVNVTSTGGGNCGTLPANVTLESSFIIDWAITKPNSFLSVDNTFITSVPVTTSSSTAATGVVTFAAGSQASVERTLWISECPGGPVFEATNWDPSNNLAIFYGHRCTVTGSSNKNVPWDLIPGLNYANCNLEPNTAYYINIKNNDCGLSACNVFLGFTTDE